jgi:uncharacterized small protein (DUF1192 family)
MAGEIKRKASLRSGAEQLFEKLSTEQKADSTAIAQDYMYHLGVASNDERLAVFKVCADAYCSTFYVIAMNFNFTTTGVNSHRTQSSSA